MNRSETDKEVEPATAAYPLIERYGLHDAGWPVDLTPLEPQFVPVYRSLAGVGVPGYAMRPVGPRPSEYDPAFVVIDEDRHRLDRRLIYAHEVGHIACCHPGSLRNLEVNDWFHDRQEIEAWACAALLLIPIEAWGWGDPPEVVAGRCEVPVWLAECYPRSWVR